MLVVLLLKYNVFVKGSSAVFRQKYYSHTKHESSNIPKRDGEIIFKGADLKHNQCVIKT